MVACFEWYAYARNENEAWHGVQHVIFCRRHSGNNLLQCHRKKSRRPTTCCNVTQNKSSGDDLLQCHQKKSHWVTTCCNFKQNKSSSKDLLCLKVLAGYYLEPTNKGIIKYKT